MKIFVINNGSTSFRFSLIDNDNNIILASGGVENISTSSSYFNYQNYKGGKEKFNIRINDCLDALNVVNDYIFDDRLGVVKSSKDIDAIGHRIVHGGEKYVEAVIVDDYVLNDIKSLSSMAPLHNSRSVSSIVACQSNFKNIDNIAVFDTSFHCTIPKENYLYAIPIELYEKYGIRKYGFHGISYNNVLNRYSEIINKDKNNINTIICHLGGGSSMCAIKEGKSFDTTMGYTPLSGLMMASRSGNIDPSIIPKMMDIYNISAYEVIEILNCSSGYFGICNDTSAKRIVERSINGEKDAILLRKMVNADFKKNLLSMMANLDHIDSVILTGGIGSKNKEQRELFMSGLEQFGIVLDKEKNNAVFNTEAIISADLSSVPIYVIPSQEELEIAKQCEKVMKKKILRK